MTENKIVGETQDRIVQSITSFASVRIFPNRMPPASL